jgi:excinuclease ABC subunit A
MQAWYMEFMSNAPCGACGGSRLRRASMAVRIGEAPGPTYNLVELCGLSIHALHAALGRLRLERSARVAEDLLRETNRRVRFLEDVGVGYLSLDRGADTLSGGETQRIRLASQLGGELCGVTYVLDEPTIGLHPRDTGRFLSLLARLRDLGNTVVVVEHDRDTIEAADFVADFGPGAGREGGRLVFAGPPEALVGCMASLTGRHLAGALGVPLPERRRTSDGRSLRVIGAREHNLAGIDVFFPLGLMVAVTGVSGAGKSTLVHGILSPALHNALHRARRPVGACDRVEGVEHLTKIIEVDQAPIGRSPRSNPATYTGLFDLLRELLAGTREARARGFGPARFSFNQKGGRCEACSGDGQRRVEMHFLPDVFVRCEVCGGSRFNESTLAVRFRGLNIAEILDMSVDDALPFFEHHPEIHRILETLRSVGLGYVSLGQPSNTLSGGEAQRIKLSRELARVSRGDTLYLLDEPTTGLHFEDTRKLLDVLSRLVDAGNTVLLVEHNLDAVKVCDHVIDLGPEGGAEGGHIVAQGTPEEIIRCAASHTGRALQRVLLR